jgi:hypothetical protein
MKLGLNDLDLHARMIFAYFSTLSANWSPRIISTLTQQLGGKGEKTMLKLQMKAGVVILFFLGLFFSSTAFGDIDKLRPRNVEPGQTFKIIGSGFGNGSDSVVHIGQKAFELGSPNIKDWTDTRIVVEVPDLGCKWFRDNDVRRQQVWVTVHGVGDSNKKGIKVIRPDLCVCGCDLNGDGVCDPDELGAFTVSWNAVECNVPGGECPCDLNHDGICDDADAALFTQALAGCQ